MRTDARLISLFDKCLSEAVDMRREQTAIPSPFFDAGLINDTWVLCQEFYDGDHYARLGVMPSWKSKPADNYPYQAVEQYTTKLTDSRPRVGFAPREKDDYPTATVLQNYYDYWWEQVSGAMALYLAVKDSRKYGVGWLHLEWSPSAKSQKLHAVHPETVLVDPDCTADDFDPTYLIYEYVAQVGALKDAFPNAEWDKFQANSTPGAWFTRILKRIGVNTTVKSPATSTTVYEFWIRDNDTVQFDVEMGDTVLGSRRKKYPGGRVLTIAGGIVLDDRPSPYRHRRFPFIPIFAYPETGKFYCHGDIARLIPLQILYNRVMQYLFDATFKSTGGIFLVNKRHGLSKLSITNDPVQVREVNDVNMALRVVQPPSPPRHMFEMADRVKRAMQDASGVNDMSQGAYTPGNKTVAEVNVLAESANTRVRMAARFLSLAITELGHMWLSNVAQFEDKATVVRVTDTDGKESSVEFNPVTELRRDVLYDTSGVAVEWDMLPLDIRVADTSTLPARQQELAIQATQLFAAKAIDRVNLLDTLDWPDRERMDARMKAEAQAAQQQAAQQQAQQPPPQGAPQGAPPPDVPQDGAPPPEVMAEMQRMSDETGIPIEEIMAEAMSRMGGVKDSAYPGGVMVGNAPVPR